MDFIVFDLEWNTNFPGSGAKASEASRLSAEITEIGAFRLHEDGRIGGSFFAPVKPRVYPKLNPWVKHITGQKFAQLKAEGRSFPEVARDFFSWAATGPAVFCSWSDSDLEPLRKNLAFYNLPTILPEYCLDVQYLYYLLGDSGQRQCALATAVAASGIQADKQEEFHNAGGDAYYTALILKKLLTEMKTAADGSVPLEQLVRRYSWNPNLTYIKRRTIRFGRRATALPELLERLPLCCPACERTLRPTAAGAGGTYGRGKGEVQVNRGGRLDGESASKSVAAEPATAVSATASPAAAEPEKNAAGLCQLPARVGGWRKKKKYYVAKAVCPDHGRVTGRVSFGLVAGRIPEVQLRCQLAKYND